MPVTIAEPNMQQVLRTLWRLRLEKPVRPWPEVQPLARRAPKSSSRPPARPRTGPTPGTSARSPNWPLSSAAVSAPGTAPQTIYRNCSSAIWFCAKVTFASRPHAPSRLETAAYVEVAEPSPLLFDRRAGSCRHPTSTPATQGGHDFCVNTFRLLGSYWFAALSSELNGKNYSRPPTTAANTNANGIAKAYYETPKNSSSNVAYFGTAFVFSSEFSIDLTFLFVLSN